MSYRSNYGIDRRGKRQGEHSASTGGGAQGCAKSGQGKRWPDFPPPVKRTAKK